MATARKSKADGPSEGTYLAVTGASGYIGNRIVRDLEMNPAVKVAVGIDVKDPSPPFERAEFFRADVRHPQIPDILKYYKINTVLHLASSRDPLRHPNRAHEFDVIGTMRLLHSCAKAGVRKVILTTSTMVYGAYPDNPHYLTEDHPARGTSQLHFCKDQVEIERMAKDLRKRHQDGVVTVLRPCLQVGRRIDMFMGRLLRQPLVPKLMGFDPLFQFLHEDDFHEALKLAVLHDLNGVYNVAPEGVMPMSKAIRMARKWSLPVVTPLAYPMVDLLWYLRLAETPSSQMDYMKYHWVASGERFRKAVPFKPRYTTEQAFKEFIETQRIKGIMEEPPEDLLGSFHVPEASGDETLEIWRLQWADDEEERT